MAAIRYVSAINPKLTEDFILSLPHVVDAKVGWSSGSLSAHVTLDDEAAYTPQQLQLKICDELGLHQTPRSIQFSSSRGTLKAA